jgi:hypothetical protein
MDLKLIELIIDYFDIEKPVIFLGEKYKDSRAKRKIAYDIIKIMKIRIDIEEFDNFIFNYMRDNFYTTNYKDLQIILERERKFKKIGI